MSYEDILNSEFVEPDIHPWPITVREYFQTLLRTLWIKEEMFSGKRPFGNSGWQRALYTHLVKEGYLAGEVYEGFREGEWELKSYDRREAQKLVLALIDAL